MLLGDELVNIRKMEYLSKFAVQMTIPGCYVIWCVYLISFSSGNFSVGKCLSAFLG